MNCIDFIEHDNEAVPIEINPRWSASMELIEQSCGMSLFAAHSEACLTSRVPSLELRHASGEPGRTLGKAILFARHDVTCGDTHAWLADPTVRDVPRPGEHIPAGRPVCTVFASGSDDADCYAALVERAARVYDQLESWSSVPA